MTITRLVFSDRCAPVDLAVRRVLHSMGTSRDTSWQDDKSLKRVASARLETGEVSVAGLPAVSLSFGVRAHFLLEARKKSLLQGRGCIFSRSSIVQVVAFRLVFGAVLVVQPATWSSSAAARI